MSDSEKTWPKTVDEAVDRLLEEMSEEDKRFVKEMSDSDPIRVHFTLGMDIRNAFGILAGNNDLIRSACGERLGFHPDDVSTVIIKALWQRLNHVP